MSHDAAGQQFPRAARAGRPLIFAMPRAEMRRRDRYVESGVQVAGTPGPFTSLRSTARDYRNAYDGAFAAARFLSAYAFLRAVKYFADFADSYRPCQSNLCRALARRPRL